jgi:hypothetical protein
MLDNSVFVRLFVVHLALHRKAHLRRDLQMPITDQLDQALTAIAELRRLNTDGVLDIVLGAIETTMDRAFLALIPRSPTP